MQQLTKQKPYFVTAGRKNLSTGKNLCQNQAGGSGTGQKTHCGKEPEMNNNPIIRTAHSM